MFALAHELAHLWLGAVDLSDCQAAARRVARWLSLGAGIRRTGPPFVQMRCSTMRPPLRILRGLSGPAGREATGLRGHARSVRATDALRATNPCANGRLPWTSGRRAPSGAAPFSPARPARLHGPSSRSPLRRGSRSASARPTLRCIANQAPPEPVRKIVRAQFTPRNVDQHLDDDLVALLQRVSASSGQQLDKIERRALVAVRESVIGDHAVDQCRRLLVNQAVVPVIGTSQRRLYRGRVEDSRQAPVAQRRIVAANGVPPSYPVVAPTDLRAPASPSAA